MSILSKLQFGKHTMPSSQTIFHHMSKIKLNGRAKAQPRRRFELK